MKKIKREIQESPHKNELFHADLVIFTEEILNEKLHFCTVYHRQPTNRNVLQRSTFDARLSQ